MTDKVDGWFYPLSEPNGAYAEQGPSFQDALRDHLRRAVEESVAALVADLPDVEVHLVLTYDHKVKVSAACEIGEHEHIVISDMDVGDFIEDYLEVEDASHPEDRARQIKTLVDLRDRLNGFIATLEGGGLV